MPNFTEVELETAKIAYKQGLTWGRMLKDSVNAKELDPTKPIKLLLPIGNINIENFSPMTRFTMQLGSSRIGVVSNSIIVGVGVYTGGNSAIQYGITTNPTAKMFYGLSVICSGSAITSGGASILARACQISQTAALSEACATAFMILGNQAHVRALQLEGKPIPSHLKRFMRKDLRPSAYDNSGLGFVMPSGTNCIVFSELIEKIPFETIGRFIGLGISVYGYSKLIIIGYRYSQQLISKLKDKKRKYKSALIKKQAQFLIISFYRFSRLRNTVSIYKLAIKTV
jgi:hypothetical protein